MCTNKKLQIENLERREVFSVASGFEVGINNFVVDQDVNQPDMCTAAAYDQISETMIQRMDGSSKDPCYVRLPFVWTIQSDH